METRYYMRVCFCLFSAIMMQTAFTTDAAAAPLATSDFESSTVHRIKNSHVHVLDSIGVEVVDGKQVIIHKLTPKETYYGLSRTYGVPVREIIMANDNKALKIGDVVRVPTDRIAQKHEAVSSLEAGRGVQQTESQVEKKPDHVQLNPGEYTEYIISRGETLYTVSKRFGVPIESIKLANGLANDNVQEGLLLKVPKKALAPIAEEPTPSAAISVSDVMVDPTLDPASRQADFELQKNRYGIREMAEKGVGVWIDDLSQEGASMLALHKTAPIGTVVKVTNPMTNHSTFVKVVGKFMDNENTQGAIIVISKSVASIIGILDRRFQIEIAYGAPVEENTK